MNRFKDYLTKKHPNFRIEESILGALGGLALGAAAVTKTAIDRSRGIKTSYANNSNGYGDSSGEERSVDNKNYDQGYKTKYLVNRFINQHWNWDKIINDGIIRFGYLYHTGSENLKDDDFTPVLKADRNLNLKISFKNKQTGKIVLPSAGKRWLIYNAKNYWTDDLIKKFYKSLELERKTPEDYNGELLGN
jgi:hypothetical protein